MKKIINLAIGVSFLASASIGIAGVDEDRKNFQNHFLKKFPKLSLQDFQNGPYALNQDKFEQFEAIMEFPPFEDFLDKGESIWNKSFKNGKNFASCFGDDVAKVRPQYPQWNEKKGKVITLEAAIQHCLKSNGENKIGWKKGKMAYISAYLTNEATGEKINVVVPDSDGAQAAYAAGKRFFYAKRGQLNMSCANCHIDNAGKRLRGNILSAALGQTTHFPVWRGKWAKKKGDGFGTLQRRFGGCNKQVRAKPFRSQQKQYTNLEYFLTAMSNGMEYSGSAYRE